ncbi:MAG TPA: PLDc N-terminal domain-containing protein [Acidimicrobiales bacterium]|nr:PLDc N-terminal domain-containing protein [Acidimicrobiales bacterium]
MLAARGALGLALLGLWIYCIIDVITTEESTVRHLPKTMWLLIVFFLPDIGSIIWLVAGRPEKASFRIGDPGYRPSKAPLGAEDRADFGVDLDGLSPPVREREERAQHHLREEQLRRRESELAAKERELALKRLEDDLVRHEREVLGGDPPPNPGDHPGGSKLEE